MLHLLLITPLPPWFPAQSLCHWEVFLGFSQTIPITIVCLPSDYPLPVGREYALFSCVSPAPRTEAQQLWEVNEWNSHPIILDDNVKWHIWYDYWNFTLQLKVLRILSEPLNFENSLPTSTVKLCFLFDYLSFMGKQLWAHRSSTGFRIQ